MEISIGSQVAGMCHQTFPHGVALLLYMMEHEIFGFSLLDGEFERMQITASVLCVAMKFGQERSYNTESVEKLEDMFQEIGQFLRTGK